ncbi:MAG: hypothetical protein O2931_04530 [Planctomycetota bacterium]|nr:hypothetical protein [Planctomycetota bacterium]MDA1178047.1 hypothetical protein [Planctomycetota bacterium]
MGLIPCILPVIFVAPTFVWGPARPRLESLHGWVTFGTVGLVIYGLLPFVLNTFSTDRSGFRSYLLMPISRRDILIGKNLAHLPWVAGLVVGSLLICSLGGLLTLAQIIATVIQVANSFLLCCLVGNFISIYFPMTIAAGTMRPLKPNLATILIQMVVVLFSPILLLPAVLASVVAFVAATFTNFHVIPIEMALALLEFAVIAWIYRRAVTAQGTLLQQRETLILNTVAAQNE